MLMGLVISKGMETLPPIALSGNRWYVIADSVVNMKAEDKPAGQLETGFGMDASGH